MHLRPAVLLAGVLMLAVPAPATALISDVRPIDGPSADVVDLGGAAMSEDGSGGVVYRRRVGGRPHIFAAQFVDGAWQPPQRVDVGQNFESSWPRIAAGDGGRLVVTWVQEFGPESDRMYSAAVDPDARRFQAPVPVDLNVGEATGTWPSLAMNRGGQAYVVYRVITNTGGGNPPGYLGGEYRLARYNGSLWSNVGVADRNPAVPIRTPSEDNAPRVAIDIQGQGLVTWQEPGDDFVDRIWARRLFGATIGNPLIVSPTTFDGAPLRGGADGFSLDIAGFGQGAIALRQQPGASGRLGATRIFVNTIPEVFTDGSGAFQGARLADGGARPAPGAAAVAVTAQTTFLTAFATGPATLTTSGEEGALSGTTRADDGGSSVSGRPRVDLAETDAAVAAWRALTGGFGGVAVQERRADGVPETTTVSAPRGGNVGGMELGGSGRGDALVAWSQGSSSLGQIAAVVVDAPPSEFNVLLPDTWQRRRRVPIAWDPAESSVSGVTYSVAVDDEPVKERIRGHKTSLTPTQLEDGRHRVELIAVDAAGQETTSASGRVLVDRRKPRARLRVRGGRLSVRVSDPAPGSGLRKRATKVSWGDGARPARRALARHLYAGPGVYRVTITTRDKAGHRVKIRRRVRIR
jgi:hypothetical protein